MPIIRKAKSSEAQKLSQLAKKSKKHWGYPDAWIEKWEDELTVTEAFIQDAIAFVIEEEGEILGFWCRSNTQSDEPSEGFLFVEPEAMGKGYGRMLWEAVKHEAKIRGLKYFTFEADPNAEPFYIKMGAKKIGEKKSSVIPGRKLPILRFTID